eukprot:1189664-Prorocentrum_minimum.AAC.3
MDGRPFGSPALITQELQHRCVGPTKHPHQQDPTFRVCCVDLSGPTRSETVFATAKKETTLRYNISHRSLRISKKAQRKGCNKLNLRDR